MRRSPSFPMPVADNIVIIVDISVVPIDVPFLMGLDALLILKLSFAFGNKFLMNDVNG